MQARIVVTDEDGLERTIGEIPVNSDEVWFDLLQFVALAWENSSRNESIGLLNLLLSEG